MFNRKLILTVLLTFSEIRLISLSATKGMGVARMRKAMAEGVHESMQAMSQGGLTPQESMHMMVTTQYLDTLKDFANNPNNSAIMVLRGPLKMRGP